MYRPWWLDTKWLWIIILQCCWGNLYPTLSLLTKEMQSFQKFNTKQFTSYTINSCTNRLICMRIYNTWIKILQIDNYLKNEKHNYLLISELCPARSLKFPKMPKRFIKNTLISHFLNKLFYLQFQVDQYCPQNVII